MSVPAQDSTAIPRSVGTTRVCPRCRAPAPVGASWDASCAEHGLAFVDARALVESNDDPLLGTTLAGRFTILSRIGSGSMGSVYRARQAAVGRDVALKIVRRDRAYDPETKARFEREARAVSRLKSPHTVTAFDFGEAEDGSWFLALEMLEGETLGERLRRERRLDWSSALRFASEALRSLSEAHTQGIIHRDLKPDNLFLARVHHESGDVETCKILDFGIAKWVREEEAPVDQLETLAGTVFGTPRYMSPEQAQGAPLDARSDLYSLGVLLFQMLAGRAPFIDDDAVVVMAKHIKEPPPDFEHAAPGIEIPAPVEAAVRRALEKLPEHRPASAEQMLRELEQARSASSTVESGVRPRFRGFDLKTSFRLRDRRVWSAFAVVLVALLGLGALATWVSRRSASAWFRDAATQAALPVRAEPTATAAAAPTPEPSAVPGRIVENSADAASLPPHADGASPLGSAAARPGRVLAPAPTKKGAKAPSNGVLERHGNERYGRFE